MRRRLDQPRPVQVRLLVVEQARDGFRVSAPICTVARGSASRFRGRATSFLAEVLAADHEAVTVADERHRRCPRRPRAAPRRRQQDQRRDAGGGRDPATCGAVQNPIERSAEAPPPRRTSAGARATSGSCPACSPRSRQRALALRAPASRRARGCPRRSGRRPPAPTQAQELHALVAELRARPGAAR